MDSLISDSTFIGTQYVNINNKNYKINIDASFAERVDTSYSIPEKMKTKLKGVQTDKINDSIRL